MKNRNENAGMKITAKHVDPNTTTTVTLYEVNIHQLRTDL